MEVTDHIDFHTATPQALIVHIDAQFKQFRKVGASRFSTEWGMWSRAMNIAIRGKTEGGGLDLVDGTPYSLVYTYWLATSQLLELYASARTRVTKQGKRRQLRMEMADIKKQLAEALI